MTARKVVLQTLEQRRLLAFAHPGILSTDADFTRMRDNVNAGAQPWVAGYNALTSDGYSQSGWTPRPLASVIRGGTGENYAQMVIDMQRAYQTAVRWKVSGNVAYANQAVTILNAWANTMTSLGGNADRFLASGLYGFGWAASAEIMRTYSGWAAADVTKFQNYLVGIYYPMQHDFLVNHNTAAITNYWANWDLANIEGMMAVGIFADRQDLYDEAVAYLNNGGGNGALDKMAYYLHPGNLMQWQESGRDQGHTVLGMQLFGHIAQTAWNQGLDLYSYNNNQFLAAAEYVAKYNLGYDVPYTFYNWGTGQSGTWSTQPGISPASRGDMDVGYELIYGHYVEQMGLAAPYSKMRIDARGTEWRGSGDEFGFGTLTYRRTPLTAPQPPRGLTVAEVTRGNIRLDFFGGANDASYRLYRSTSLNGTYTLIASNITDLLSYTDLNLPAGVYYYKVTGVSGSTETAASNVVSATSTTLAHTQLSFDENTGTTANDSTNNGHTGTLVGGVTWTAGKAGSAVALNGSTGYVSLPTGVVEDVDDFTISAWVNLSTAATWSRIFDFGDDRGRWMYLTPRNGNGVVEFATSTVYGYNKQTVTGTATLPTNQWVHVAVTLSDDVGRLYVNGALVGSTVGMAFPPSQIRSTTRNWIGRSQFAADPYLNGKVDDFRITRGAMTTGEIYTLATGATAPAVPAAPASLTATAIPGGGVNLTWSAVSGATSGYTLLRTTNVNGPYETIATRLTGTSFADTGRVAGTTYYYAVTVANAGGDSARSPVASVVALPPLPGAPANVSAKPTSSGVITLSWTAGLDAASYTVSRATTPGGPYAVIASKLTTTTYADAGRAIGITYYYVVTSVNASGAAASSEVAVTHSDLLVRLKLDESTGTAAADATGHGWTGTLTNGPVWTTGRASGAVQFDGVDDYVSLPAGVVNGLTTATFAMWVNVSTFATWARLFDFGTDTTNYLFLAPQYTATAPNTAKLRFGIRTPSVAEQQITSTVAMPAGTWAHVAVVLNGSVGTLYLNGVQAGQTTNLTLNPSSLGNTTLNYLGKSQWADPYLTGSLDDFRIYNRALTSAEVSSLATTTSPPSTPSGLTATPSNGTVTLNWAVQAGASGYVVRRSMTEGGPYTTVAAGVTGTSFVDTVLTNGTTYYYVVAATNLFDVSPDSAQVSAVPVANAAPTIVTPPAALASPIVAGKSVTLSALGADDAGESNLTYAWSIAGTAPGVVTFAVNGTNAAKSTSVAFAAAGTYHLQLTITDTGGLSVTAPFDLTVALPGDANLDGMVNFTDLLTLASNYGLSVRTWSQGDFTGDGTVNFNDLLVLAQSYGTSAAPAASGTSVALTSTNTTSESRRIAVDVLS
ncbi:MAG: alginate lyase family protein [Tepidisphaeraceae bacterium]